MIKKYIIYIFLITLCILVINNISCTYNVNSINNKNINNSICNNLDNSIIQIKVLTKAKYYIHNKHKKTYYIQYNGSGSLITLKNNKQGILTAYHVVKNSDIELKKRLFNIFLKLRYKNVINNLTDKKQLRWKIIHKYIMIYDNKEYEINYIKGNMSNDLALFSLNKRVNNCDLKISKQKLKRFDKIDAYGFIQYSHGKRLYRYSGHYIQDGFIRVNYILYVSEYTIPVWPGMSGGPVLYKNKIVGVVAARHPDPHRDVSFGARLENIYKILK